jgi:DAK2 domain fusion protein YloV
LSLFVMTGNDFIRSIKAGCIKLEHNRDSVDLLNVFPVPDGDTGTNMYLTLMSAVREGEKNRDQPLGKLAKSVSMGSLMGARGNSGVILSQIFRGMARVLEGKEQAGAMDIAQALKAGADTAYEAVMKPVEGTILTVSREIGRACEAEAKKNDDIMAVLLAGIEAGHTTLARTPSMLPILKEAGVVDAGGRGFLFFLEGFVEGLAQEREIKLEQYREQTPAEVTISREDIELDFQYCTEVLIKGQDLDPLDVRDHLAILEENVLVGHAAIVHGPCLIKHNATIGMGSIVSSNTEVGEESLLAAGSILPPGKSVPPRKIAMGNPARVVKDMDDYNLVYNQVAVKLYQDLAQRCTNGLKLIEE